MFVGIVAGAGMAIGVSALNVVFKLLLDIGLQLKVGMVDRMRRNRN